MKKLYKKLLSFLTVICCLAGSLGTVHASGSGEVPRVVFENESDGSAALYVGKEVVDAEGRTVDPSSMLDVDFTFVLTLSTGGETWTWEQAYTLCDLNGKEFSRKELADKFDQTVDANSFLTRNGGRFSLKAGQMARFSGIPVGTDYTIRETPKSGYTQVYPAGGEGKSGSKENKNETFIFKNRADTGGGDEAKLEISKTVSFPDNYVRPETPDFTFQLTLGREAAANLPYKVKDSSTNQKIGEGMTSEDGEFTLKGGQTAVFEGKDENGVAYIPNGTDYEVTEINLPEGWRASDAGPKKGGVNGTTLVNFHNSEVSFVVTKRMEDFSTPEVDFRFELKKEDGALWSGAKYYRYDTRTNTLILPEEDSELQYHTTNADGTFVLRPGQAAVFIGIPLNTVYSVKEIADPEYIQTQPMQTEGYTGQVVESSIRTLSFVNDRAEYSRLLTVTKEVVNKKGDASETSGSDVFHFILRKLNSDGKQEEVKGAVYSVQVGNSKNTYRTGVERSDLGKYPNETYLKDMNPGEFTLKANETARFEGLLEGTYIVEEVDLPGGYELEAEDSGADGENAGEDAAALGSADTGSGTDTNTRTGVLEEKGHTSLTFTNSYWSDRTDLQIRKTNPAGDPLEGAEFRLLKAEMDGDGNETGTTAVGTGVSDAEGKIIFSVPLTEGTWYVEETKVPVGYQMMSGRLKIVIGRDENGLPTDPEVTWENGDAVPDADAQQPEGGDTAETADLAKYTFTQGDQTRDQLTLIIKNEYLYSLPKTGGTGTAPYTLAGIALMTAAAFFYIRRRRPGRL